MSNETTDRIREALATPAAGADVRERAASEIERGILAALDEADEEGAPLEIARAVARRLATTGLLRTPSGEGEAEAQKVEAVLRRWNRLAGDVGGSEGPLTETEIAAISRDVAAALRSEAQGEDDITGDELLRSLCRSLIGRIMEASDPDAVDTPGDVSLRLESIIRERDRLRSEAPGEVWREVDDLLARLERFEYDAAGESEEYWRVVTIRDRIAAARGGEGGGE